jgi:hypothetical protein
MIMTGRTERLGEEPVPVPLCPQQALYEVEVMLEGSGRGLILRCYPSICLERLRKVMKNLKPAGLLA